MSSYLWRWFTMSFVRWIYFVIYSKSFLHRQKRHFSKRCSMKHLQQKWSQLHFVRCFRIYIFSIIIQIIFFDVTLSQKLKLLIFSIRQFNYWIAENRIRIVFTWKSIKSFFFKFFVVFKIIKIVVFSFFSFVTQSKTTMFWNVKCRRCWLFNLFFSWFVCLKNFSSNDCNVRSNSALDRCI